MRDIATHFDCGLIGDCGATAHWLIALVRVRKGHPGISKSFIDCAEVTLTAWWDNLLNGMNRDENCVNWVKKRVVHSKKES